MKREELEHVLRAASRIVKQRDFLVIGSAAILGTYSESVLPGAASRSEEADLAPFDDPTGEKSAAVEGSLGQLSPFHEMYGYYVDGVDFKTATAPEGWEQRLVAFAPPGASPGILGAPPSVEWRTRLPPGGPRRPTAPPARPRLQPRS
jgi:hypothetical protein